MAWTLGLRTGQSLPRPSGGVAVSSHRIAVPALWAGLSSGPFPVGYRRLDAGPVVTHVWYPARNVGPALRVRDYLGADAPRLESFLESAKIPSASIRTLLDRRLAAAPAPEGLNRPVPLVLVAQGNGEDAFDQVVLCEYLASEGFAVATTPSPMLKTPMTREDQVGELAERQASDLAAAVDALSAALSVERSRVGVVGHSFGARAALLLAMRDPRVRAIVSLDGGIGTATALDSFRSAPSFRADASLPPILHFYETLDPFMTPDFGLLRSLRTAELDLVPTHALHHVHFTTYGFVAAVDPAIAAATGATAETGPEAAGVARRTARFLELRLR